MRDEPDLTLHALRDANVARSNEAFHCPIDGWSESEWACACAGEVGELCNLIKKRRRGDAVDVRAVANELADCVIYLDLLAARMGINLAEAIVRKFNSTSDQNGSVHFLFLSKKGAVK